MLPSFGKGFPSHALQIGRRHIGAIPRGRAAPLLGFAAFFLGSLCSCASQQPSRAEIPGRSAPADRTKARARGTLERAQVVAVVDAGLGRFLQRVDVEPSFAAGQFQGFRIVALRPPAFWRSVDLRPGDIVLQVNHMPIERETQAYDAFQTLRASPELRVDYLRDGQPRVLRYAIADVQ